MTMAAFGTFETMKRAVWRWGALALLATGCGDQSHGFPLRSDAGGQDGSVAIESGSDDGSGTAPETGSQSDTGGGDQDATLSDVGTSETGSTGMESGSEAAADQDAGVPEEAGSDAAITSGLDGASPDGAGPDASGDAATSETGTDAMLEAAVEAGPEAGLEAGAEASLEAGADAAAIVTALLPLPRSGWSVSSNPAVTGADSPASAIDGNLTTRFSTDAAMQPGFYFQIDLGSTQKFTQITLDGNGNAGDSAVSYSVMVSNDGTTWGTAIASGNGGAALLTITFPEQTARYVQITQTGTSTSWWSIDEVNVWAQQPLVQTPASGNPAPLSRAAWVATAFPIAGDAPSNAIDGNAGTRYSPDQNQTPWQYFEVNLGSAQTFSQATLDAAGSAGDYPSAYEIFVSNDDTTWGSPIAVGLGSTQLITVQFPAQTAQYVRVYVADQSSTNWWSLAEFNLLQ